MLLKLNRVYSVVALGEGGYLVASDWVIHGGVESVVHLIVGLLLHP